MSLSIATNTASSFASNALRSTQASLATSAERLSSGKRVNSAKDDAAGLAISDRMLAQSNGLSIAARNVNDAISALQIADGSAQQCVDQLQRIRELAVQASNGPLTSNDRLALQEEVFQVFSSAMDTQNNTVFNGSYLLNGSFSNKDIQVGPNYDESIDCSIPSLELPIDQKYVYIEGGYYRNEHVQAINDGDLTINGVAIPASVASGLPFVSADSVGAIEAAINSMAIPDISVEAVYPYEGITFDPTATGFSIPSGGIVINGVNIPASSGATLLDSYYSLAASINTQTGLTGIFSDGPRYEARRNLWFFYVNSQNGGTLDMQNGVSGALGNAGLRVHNHDTGYIFIRSAESVPPYPEISIGGNHPEKIGISAGTYSSNRIIYADRPDVTTQSAAQETMADIDALIDHITSVRASIGAKLSIFDKVIDSLSSYNESIKTASSRIVDADYAQETSNLTRVQILQQAATAMIAQANISKKSVLALLNNN
jgi:flagellin